MKNPRNHIVTFRLTEDEYLRLKSACGADDRSISATVRRTVLAWARLPGSNLEMEQRLSDISDRLETLEGILAKGE